MSVNKVIMVGGVATDPSSKFNDGPNVERMSFNVATSSNFKRKDGARDSETLYHKIVAFGRQAQEMESSELKKGDRIYLEGRIRYREVIPNESDTPITITEIVVIAFTILQRKRVEGNTQQDNS